MVGDILWKIRCTARPLRTSYLRENALPLSFPRSTYTPPTCEGGRIFEAFTYVSDVSGGITYDSLYPYNVSATACDKTKHDYPVTAGYDIHVPGEQAMVNHVLMGGTLSALIDAATWGSYKSGIYSGCGSDLTINHVVQIVGVDVPGGFWILRNSWGPNWGDNGYMKLALVCMPPISALAV